MGLQRHERANLDFQRDYKISRREWTTISWIQRWCLSTGKPPVKVLVWLEWERD
jgi:hypothetical protein